MVPLDHPDPYASGPGRGEVSAWMINENHLTTTAPLTLQNLALDLHLICKQAAAYKLKLPLSLGLRPSD
jgi:hypothetical protein